VTLNFTPLVLGEGRILLRVATEVTELDPATNVVFRDVTVPGFRSRKNETSVEIPSGGSMVTAGLIQTTGKQAINGLPGLMNLPILGSLFRSREYQRSETELMIVVTPYLVRPVNPQEVARPTDNMSDATDAQALMLGRMNRLYATTDNPQIIKNFKGKVGFIAD
jgi:pilus assembly protein CpaC